MSLEFVGVLLVFLFEVIEAENSNLIQPFIVNGTDAQIEEFPYLVRREAVKFILQVHWTGNWNVKCAILRFPWGIEDLTCVEEQFSMNSSFLRLESKHLLTI